jgi:hypothetical protein
MRLMQKQTLWQVPEHTAYSMGDHSGVKAKVKKEMKVKKSWLGAVIL